MHDHNLHLADQNALDLRHPYMTPWHRLTDKASGYVDSDTYASAALHCMRFISNPPKYSERNERPEMGLIYEELRATCDLTLELLCKLLQRANTLSELVQFISDHDIDPGVQKDLHDDRVWEVNVNILAFLSRASVCSNWRIISMVQRSLIIASQQSSKFEENNASSDEDEEWRTILLQRHDQCCSNAHYEGGRSITPIIQRRENDLGKIDDER